MSNDFIVYKHTCPNNKMYIGITSNDVKRRWQNGKGYNHNKHFSNAIKKYGWDNIKHEILFENLSQKEAENKEKALIEKYNLTDKRNGYNCCSGGNVGAIGHTVSKEARDKISKNNKNKIPWNKGLKMSEEQKQLLRNIGKSRNLVGNNNPFYGCKHTEETKRKISDTHKGKAPWNKGIPMLKKSKEKMSKPVLCVETGIVYYSLTNASEQTQIPFSNISKCCSGKRKTAGGYKWRFANET